MEHANNRNTQFSNNSAFEVDIAKELKRINKFKRKLSRQMIGGKNYYKTKHKINRLYQKIRNKKKYAKLNNKWR